MYMVHLKDGRTLRESEVEWKDIPQDAISSVQLYRQGQIFTLSVDGAKVKILQLKRNVLDMLHGTNDVTERVIGFIWQDKVAVKLEVDERSGNAHLTLEVRDEKGKWRRV